MKRSVRARVRTHSSAWPLAAAWALLIAYASLHPFAGWQGPIEARWLERIWLARPTASRFDLWSNFLAYQPLGLLLAVGWLRAGHGPLRATLQAVAAAGGLSLLMEWTQILLPMRVPSRVDLMLNTAGGLVGALLAAAAADLGLLRRWQRLRDRWLVPRSAAGLTLLLTWPVGLLFPPPVPLGLGEGLSRAGRALHEALQDSTLHAWLPVPAELAPLPPLLELAATTLGLLAPCWIAFVLAQGRRHRLVLLLGATGLGLGATTLSTALNFGPDHALTWVTPTLVPAVTLGLVAGALVALLPARWVAALGLVGLTSLVALLAQAGTDPYFASSLQGWEQGRFIRFHGLARWIGWVWPYAALLYLLGRVAERAPLEAR